MYGLSLCLAPPQKKYSGEAAVAAETPTTAVEVGRELGLIEAVKADPAKVSGFKRN